MILTRTPLRISFLGGGTDYPGFFRSNGGCVLGTTVNLHVYTTIVQHSELADAKFKISYRLNESVNSISEIDHPLVRATLQELNWGNQPLHISTLADVPAMTGLGSSSSFAVGLIQALSSLQGQVLSARELAKTAIKIERDLLREHGGWQDQILAAYGGLNLIQFAQNDFDVTPIRNAQSIQKELSSRLVLVAAGEPRRSTHVAELTNSRSKQSDFVKLFGRMSELTSDISKAIESAQNSKSAIDILAQGVLEAWNLKKQISVDVDPNVEKTILAGMRSGAVAAKLCGAGGTGFVAFILGDVESEEFISKFSSNRIQRVSCFPSGSEIAYQK